MFMRLLNGAVEGVMTVLGVLLWVVILFGLYILRKLFKSTLNNRLCSNLACVIDESSRGVKLKRVFEELP